MSEKSLKKRIKKKFGTLSGFYKASGMTAYEIQRKSIIQIRAIIDKTEATVSSGKIPAVKLGLLRAGVMASGGVMLFCEKNTQFNDRTLFQILQGRRKRMSPVVVDLFKHFNI